MNSAQLFKTLLWCNTCIWIVWCAFLVIAFVHSPENGSLQLLCVAGFMGCLTGALTRNFTFGNSRMKLELQLKLICDFYKRKLPHSKLLAVSFRVTNLSVLLATTYVLVVSLGLLLSITAQLVSAYELGEEIYRWTPGYKFALAERPISSLWVSRKTPSRAALESTTKQIYGSESLEMGYFYRECADGSESLLDRRKYLNQALKLFERANLVKEGIECKVILAHLENDDRENLAQAYFKVYPLVLEHPTFFSCFYLERIATQLQRPEQEFDRLKTARSNIGEYNPVVNAIAFGLVYVTFAVPLISVALFLSANALLRLLGLGLRTTLRSAKTDEKRFETLNTLTTIDLFRWDLKQADQKSRALLKAAEHQTW